MFAVGIGICLVLVASAFAQTAAPAGSASKPGSVSPKSPADPELIHVDELKRGMKGYGLTVFTGTEPEKFSVEVVDVIRRMRPGQDAVICRIGGHDLENSGIAQGMSGSPVYFDGRLAGALSFGWSFTKGPICGMTPIKHMIEVSQESGERGSLPLSTVLERSFGYRATLPFVPCLFRAAMPGADPAPRLGRAVADKAMPGEAKSLMLPVSCSGVSPDALRLLNAHLMPAGMLAFSGGASQAGGSRPARGPVTLAPGSAIGVRFSAGDLDISGVGTATCVYGGKVIAFGHGMFQSGAVSMPLATAVVHGFVPSTYMSFKLSSPLNTVGALEFDGRAAIVGVMGKVAPMIPIELVVHDNAERGFKDQWFPKGTTRSHHARVVRHPFYTGLVGAFFVQGFSTYRAQLPRLSTLVGRMTITLDGGRTIAGSA